jgi:hypothetical protein
MRQFLLEFDAWLLQFVLPIPVADLELVISLKLDVDAKPIVFHMLERTVYYPPADTGIQDAKDISVICGYRDGFVVNVISV